MILSNRAKYIFFNASLSLSLCTVSFSDLSPCKIYSQFLPLLCVLRALLPPPPSYIFYFQPKHMPANFSFSLGNARIHTNLSLPPWCSLSTYYAPRTALSVRETSVHKTDTNLSLCGKYILVAKASWLSPGSWPLCPVALTFLQFSAFNLRPVRNQEFSLTFQIKLYSCQPSVSLMTNIELNDKRKIELAEKGRDCGMSTL